LIGPIFGGRVLFPLKIAGCHFGYGERVGGGLSLLQPEQQPTTTIICNKPNFKIMMVMIMIMIMVITAQGRENIKRHSYGPMTNVILYSIPLNIYSVGWRWRGRDSEGGRRGGKGEPFGP
jgi:hypothetical protein